jgi:hypothetical protein
MTILIKHQKHVVIVRRQLSGLQGQKCARGCRRPLRTLLPRRMRALQEAPHSIRARGCRHPSLLGRRAAHELVHGVGGRVHVALGAQVVVGAHEAAVARPRQKHARNGRAV